MARKYWKGGNAGVEGSFTESLTSLTLTASAAVDLGDGKVQIPCAHAGAFVENDYVVIDGTSYYEGNHLITNVADNNSFDIKISYTAETFDGTETAKSSNWQDEDGVPVAAPVTGDTIIFNELAGIATDVSTKHTKGKRWNCIENIAQGDTGGLELTDMIVRQGFDGKIGVDASNSISPLHISIADDGTILYQSNAEAYIECSAANSTTTINIPLLVFDTSAGYLRISSDVNTITYKAAWDEVRCLNRGTLELMDNTVCQTIRTYDSNVTVIIGSNCVDLTDSSNPIDLYIGSEDIYSITKASNTIESDGIINFGIAALTLTKGR